jgi:hypothetical protein
VRAAPSRMLVDNRSFPRTPKDVSAAEANLNWGANRARPFHWLMWHDVTSVLVCPSRHGGVHVAGPWIQWAEQSVRLQGCRSFEMPRWQLVCCLTFELRGRPTVGCQAWAEENVTTPRTRPGSPPLGLPLERRVRPHVLPTN